MKFKIFISSRNNDEIIIDGKNLDTLTEIRKYLKKEIEQEKFLGNDFFELIINEEFATDTSKESYYECLEQVKKADFFIALYNGNAGWAPDGVDFGICHAEFDTALNISTKKTSLIDITKFSSLNPSDKKEKKRNEYFKKYLEEINIFKNPLKLSKANRNIDGFKIELLNLVKKIIFNHIIERFKTSNIYYNIAANNKLSLNWKKLKYQDRAKNITSIIKSMLEASPDFQDFIYDVFAIPDNMSVNDAKAFAGRPFLTDHDIIKTHINKQGPIHFIGVYGNATEIQVKNLIGFPDISVIKDVFGIYVWDQNTHVQIVFLTECRTQEAVRSKFLLFNNWCKSTGEYKNIIKRAKARFHIVKSINEATIIAEKK